MRSTRSTREETAALTLDFPDLHLERLSLEKDIGLAGLVEEGVGPGDDVRKSSATRLDFHDPTKEANVQLVVSSRSGGRRSRVGSRVPRRRSVRRSVLLVVEDGDGSGSDDVGDVTRE
jgi:hypothetical protein